MSGERAGWRSKRVAVVCALGAILCVMSLIASRVHAQSEPSATDRAAAGEAYDRGTAAYLAHEYPRAAQLFETAYRLAPSAPALIQAIRAREHADGGALRAGTLALRLQGLYGSDRAAARQAQTTLQHAQPLFLRVDVTCDASCTIELDGTLEPNFSDSSTSFFVDPASAHTVRASFDTGTAASQSTSGAVGETQALSFARPAAPAVEHHEETVATVTPETRDAIAPPTTQPASSGLHPALFITFAGLAAVAGGVLIWSAVDMYAGVPAYQMTPTTAGLQDGQSRELRTDILWGVTGALAATAVVLAIFTDWDGGSSDTQAPHVSLMGVPGGGGLRVDGTF